MKSQKSYITYKTAYNLRLVIPMMLVETRVLKLTHYSFFNHPFPLYSHLLQECIN